MTYNLHRGFVMDKVSVDLQHCYGIKALKYDFEFIEEPRKRAYAIYAPNGAMKSSFALTFKALSEKSQGAVPRDRMYPDLPTVARVTDETGADIENERIYVVPSYDRDLGRQPSEEICKLLVNDKLRAEFAELHAMVKAAEDALLNLIKQQSKSKTDLGAEISAAFMPTPDNFRGAILRIPTEIEEQEGAPFASVEYDRIFTQEFVDLLNTKSLKDKITDYVERYNELLDQSAFFSKDVFDYYNAAEIAASLTKNGFFKAKHSINLKPSLGDIKEINTKEELEALIEQEKKLILEDEKLVAEFSVIQTMLNKNQRTRDFRDYLMANREIVPNLANIEQFRQDVLKSYMKANDVAYVELVATYRKVRERQEEIEEAAKEETTLWRDVIDLFNSRFRVPFTLSVKNAKSVIVGRDKTMQLGFVYNDGEHAPRDVERDDLIDVLSQGEKRAFYLLNVLFEIARRRGDEQETLIVADDIADSFDYQNKYAIIQYLSEIVKEGWFKLIILTHNFDFFRTVESRFVHRKHCLMASRTDAGIDLEPAIGIRNIFAKHWKGRFFDDDRMKVACIPFLRNLVELKNGTTGADYRALTSMVHWKPETPGLTVAALDQVYYNELGDGGPSTNAAQGIYDLIISVADSLPAPAGLNLENKIVLAIATRMRADRFMVEKIGNDEFWKGITRDQTPKLIERFKADFPEETKAATVLDSVALMTPENIHLNAFMYEPIIDMSEDRLRDLYADVKALA